MRVNNEVMESIKALMEELRQVIAKAKETTDTRDLFTISLAYLEEIFREEADDVSVLELWSDIRLP